MSTATAIWTCSSARETAIPSTCSRIASTPLKHPRESSSTERPVGSGDNHRQHHLRRVPRLRPRRLPGSVPRALGRRARARRRHRDRVAQQRRLHLHQHEHPDGCRGGHRQGRAGLVVHPQHLRYRRRRRRRPVDGGGPEQQRGPGQQRRWHIHVDHGSRCDQRPGGFGARRSATTTTTATWIGSSPRSTT